MMHEKFSLTTVSIAGTNDDDDSSSPTLIAIADVLFMNNWAFDDLRSGDLL